MFPEALRSNSRGGGVFQQCSIWYPINWRWCMLNMIYLITPLSERTEMCILGNKKTVVMTPLWFLEMTSICVTLSLLVIHISAVIKCSKSATRTYPLSSLVLQNTGSTQEKQKLPQILPLTKWLKWLSLIQFWSLLMLK